MKQDLTEAISSKDSMKDHPFDFIRIMDDLTIRRKLVVLFVFCVLLPLFATDGVIIYLLRQDNEARLKYEMMNIASAMESDIRNTVDTAVESTMGLYTNRALNEFLDTDYESEVDYYTARFDMLNQPFADISLSNREYQMIMYTDNPSIISGGTFCTIQSASDTPWLEAINGSDQDVLLYHYYYGGANKTYRTFERRISVIRRLNFFKNLKYNKLVKIDIDYSTFVRGLNNMKYSMPVYLCEGNTILYSNEGYSDLFTPFDELGEDKSFDYESDFVLYGRELRLLIRDSQRRIDDGFKDHIPLFLLLVLINILLPVLLMFIINRSFSSRLRKLSTAFDNVNEGSDSLEEIDDAHGRDEIGSLMRNYNRMVIRLKELIRTVYEERLKKQETDIARQQAELLALHSQINPHFLFNVLESIRMHSIIKKEDETAGMIERLAILERQNVDWSDDHVRLKDELKFIEAYLELQKYRFGDKLSYKMSIKNGCENYYMPKLTLETFVENACVHGAESKPGPTYIYIRVYEQDDRLYMEVEDTGGGMSEEETDAINEKMRNCTIDDLKSDKHVGMINACLRLKMLTSDRARVIIESEKGVGTTILISIPLDTLTVTDQR